jgi:DNA-binding transcriptional LysR family regulator
MMTLQKLKIFAIVCEQGSLNKAAQTLYLSQSAVSQHIQDLEASLGTELLQRTPRGTYPTEAGDILLDYAYRVQDFAGRSRRAHHAD